jgi:hypothetical protein
MQLDVQYSDAPLLLFSKPGLLPVIFSLKETLTIATLRSDEFTAEWVYDDISLPCLRTLNLGVRKNWRVVANDVDAAKGK